MELIPWQPMINDAPQKLSQGVYHAVHITMDEADLDWMLDKFDRWFADRDEIIHIENGTSDKQRLGFILLEWEETMIDPLFLKILEEEERVIDYTTYERTEAEG
ncbi:MAG TPA: hypothetical protein VHV10_19670 [Ktedonobacteraceae bacterium]|jgi:hypothetical protein|nr:hypothetical protein [Ktedonobacteraceae bacterium]